VQTLLQWRSCVFVALAIQHAMRKRDVVICGLPGSTILFRRYLIKSTIFEKKFTEHKMCVLFALQFFSETFLTLRRLERDIIKNV